MKKCLNIVMILCLLVFIFPYVSFSLEKPKWLKDFEEFAQKQGDPQLLDRVRAFSDPKALALAKEWREYLGYDAPSIVANSKIAQDIKPGIVINEKNYMDYPGLKDILPTTLYDRLKSGSYNQLAEIKIIPTSQYYLSRPHLIATKKYEGKSKVGPRGEITGWKGGIPFPHPKSAIEVALNFDRISIAADNFSFNPATFTMFNRKGKLERTEKADLYWNVFNGRVELPPVPDIPGYEGTLEKGSLMMVYPFDLKGFIGVRTRFKAPDKPDEFLTYIPALRRIRRLAGTDTQDPIIGTDISWEDWRAWWQKIELWPLEFRFKETIVLQPYFNHKSTINVENYKYKFYWEKRPCYLLEVVTKTTDYLYSKRRIWIDKETYRILHQEMYDARGGLWKDATIIMSIQPDIGYINWLSADFTDHSNRHRTFMRMTEIKNDPNVSLDFFNIKFLIKRAH
jgi:hypothetical protein